MASGNNQTGQVSEPEPEPDLAGSLVSPGTISMLPGKPMSHLVSLTGGRRLVLRSIQGYVAYQVISGKVAALPPTPVEDMTAGRGYDYAILPEGHEKVLELSMSMISGGDEVFRIGCASKTQQAIASWSLYFL